MPKSPHHISDTEAEILSHLISRPDSYGLDMVKASGGKLKRGTIYVLLSRLDEKKMVTSKLEEPQKGQRGSARRIYRATGLGEGSLAARRQYELQLGGLTNSYV